MLLIFGFANLPNRELHLTFLDVGQGDAILIETPSQQKILIDAGPAGAILSPLAQELSFWEREIDLAILTHPDADHIAGLVELLKRYKIKRIALTGVQPGSEWYQEILRQIAEQKIPTTLTRAGMTFDLGDAIQFQIFWPPEILAGKFIGDANAASIAGKLIFGKTSAILTGDLDTDSEKIILQNPPDLAAQILKLGHHGSKTSSSTEFLNSVHPEFAIVSASADNSFGHPSPETLARLDSSVKVLETSKLGSIHFESNGKTWQLEN
ncbi:MAG: ComEC/Rec2 family competence protein [Patescibacteria group bacterium]